MSPRTAEQFREMREEKMTHIMDVALEHFASEGYYGTTISHIARHAGMSKGLMYNYFESKEALLKAIIHKSLNEIYQYLDLDRDGHLSDEEFDYFVNRIHLLLKEKRSFWQLMLQLLLQADVREQLIKVFQDTDSLVHPGHEPGDSTYPFRIIRMFNEYFNAKRQRNGSNEDTENDLELFYINLLGFAIKTIYIEQKDQVSEAKTIKRIIAQFK